VVFLNPISKAILASRLFFSGPMPQGMRSLFLVLLVAFCSCLILAHASPASEMEAHLNAMQAQLMENPVASDLEEGQANNEAAYAKGLEELNDHTAVWPLAQDEHPEGLSLAEASAGAGANAEAEANADMEAQAEAEADVDMSGEAAIGGIGDKIKNMVSQGMLTKAAASALGAVAKKAKNAFSEKLQSAERKLKELNGGSGGGSTIGSMVSSAIGSVGNSILNRGVPNSLKKLRGSGGLAQSRCVACQYFVQRLLGALLTPFYTNEGTGAPKSLLYKQLELKYTPTGASQAPSFLEILAESESEADASSEVASEMDAAAENEDEFESSFSELDETAPDSPYADKDEERQQQIQLDYALEQSRARENSIENVLEQLASAEMSQDEAHSQLQVDEDQSGPIDLAKKAIKGVKKAGKSLLKGAKKLGKGIKKGVKKVGRLFLHQLLKRLPKTISGKSLRRTEYGPMYSKYQLEPVEAFFMSICHRRVPSEYQAACRTLWLDLDVVIEELTVGDRPDEVCMRRNLCNSSSYLRWLPHSSIRQEDFAEPKRPQVAKKPDPLNVLYDHGEQDDGGDKK